MSTHTGMNGQAANRIDGALEATGKSQAGRQAKGKGKAESAPRPRLTAEERAQRKAEREAAAAREADRKARRRRCRVAAGVAGGVGVCALALSVSHCSSAISALTGSGWFLSALLAVAIDAGMVAAEVATLLGHGTTRDAEVSRWAGAYLAVAVILSMGLNAWAFAQHAPHGWAWAGVVLGLVVPALVYGIGRYAGALWLTEPEPE